MTSCGRRNPGAFSNKIAISLTINYKLGMPSPDTVI